MSTTLKSRTAAGMAALFAAGTCYILFDDVITGGAKVTPDHVMTILALVGAVAAGIYAERNFSSRRWALALVMGLFAFTCTSFVALKSGMRNSEHVAAKAKRIDEANAERHRIKVQVVESGEAIDAAKKAVAKECRTGNGTRCKGATRALEVEQSHAALLEARHDRLGGEELSNAGYKALAETLVSFGLVKADINALADLLARAICWAAAVIVEIGMVIFSHNAFGHSPKGERVILQSFPETKVIEEKPAVAEETVENVVQLFPKTSGNGKHPVITALESVDGPVTNNELAEILGCSPVQAHRMRRQVADQIVETRLGKWTYIELRGRDTAATA